MTSPEMQAQIDRLKKESIPKTLDAFEELRGAVERDDWAAAFETTVTLAEALPILALTLAMVGEVDV